MNVSPGRPLRFIAGHTNKNTLQVISSESCCKLFFHKKKVHGTGRKGDLRTREANASDERYRGASRQDQLYGYYALIHGKNSSSLLSSHQQVDSLLRLMALGLGSFSEPASHHYKIPPISTQRSTPLHHAESAPPSSTPSGLLGPAVSNDLLTS